MSTTVIIGISFIILFLVLSKINKTNDGNGDYIGNSENGNQKYDLKKTLYCIVLFVPIFIAYYFLIALVLSIPLFYIAGAESGAWAYAMILGLVGSPILTTMTIVKVFLKNR